MLARLGVAVCVLAILPACARAAPPLRVTPSATVTGANVELRGTGLSGRTRVRIGPRRATVTRTAPHLLRVVIPHLRPGRYVVRAGAARTRIRVLRPYAGHVGIRVEPRRARHAIIGPGGGSLNASSRDGTRFTLTVPKGALAAGTRITIAPARISGLPLTGGASHAVKLTPNGLRFPKPARLEIKLRRRPRQRVVGFASAGDGSALGFEKARVRGRTITTEVAHFSAEGAGAADPADIAIFLAGLVNAHFPLSVAEIDLLREQVAVWTEIWGEDVCIELCATLAEPILLSLADHLGAACAEGTAAPSIYAYRRLVNLDGLRAFFGGDALSERCRNDILSSVVEAALAAIAIDPLATADTGRLPDGAGVQLDDDERVTALEWVAYLSTETQILGEDALDARLDAALAAAWGRIVALDQPGCDTAARDRSTDRLRTAYAYTQRLLVGQDEIVAALDYCRVEVDMAPLAAFRPGEQRQLVPRVIGLLDPAHAGVTWAASAGTVTELGIFTAPDTAGTYSITVTSRHNPQRFWVTPVVVGCVARALLAADQCTGGDVSLTKVFGQVTASAGLIRGSTVVSDEHSASAGALPMGLSTSAASGLSNPPASASAAATLDSSIDASASGFTLSVASSYSGHVAVTADDSASPSGNAGATLQLDFATTRTASFSVAGTADDTGRGNVHVALQGADDDYVNQDTNNAPFAGSSGSLPPGSYTFSVLTNAAANRSSPDEDGQASITLSVAG